MSIEGQAFCFMAGAGSIFAGDKLLTTPNPEFNDDMEMFKLLNEQSIKNIFFYFNTYGQGIQEGKVCNEYSMIEIYELSTLQNKYT